MNSAPYLFQGRIFWREVENLVTDGEKRRPLIIISSNDDIRTHPTLHCVACSHSTALLQPLPPGCILLPAKIGKRSTKLSKPTAAVTYWIVEIEKAAIAFSDLAGSIGEHILLDVLHQSKSHIEAFLSRQAQTLRREAAPE